MVLLTSSLSDGQVLEAVRLGADVQKESAPQQLSSCLESVVSGERWFDAEVTRRAVGEAVSHRARDEATKLLSPRELEIVRLVARGLRNKEIARELRITEGTAQVNLHTICEKLEVSFHSGLANCRFQSMPKHFAAKEAMAPRSRRRCPRLSRPCREGRCHRPCGPHHRSRRRPRR